MQFSINTDTFKKVLAALAHNVPSRSTAAAIFSGMRLTVMAVQESKVLRMTVCDGDLSVNVTVAVCGEAVEGSVIVTDAKILSQLVQTLPGGEIVSVEADDKTLTVNWTGGMASLPVTDDSQEVFDSSVVDADAVETDVEFDCDELRSCIQTVAPVIQKNDLRPQLSGIRFAFRDNDMDVVGTDGSRLSIRTIGSRSNEGAVGLTMSQALSDAVVSIICLGQLKNAVLEADARFARVSFTASEGDVMSAQVRGTLVGGKYPAYGQVVPTNTGRVCVLDRASLLGAIKRTAVCANPVKSFTSLRFSADGLTLNTADLYSGAKSEETMGVDSFEGQPLEMSILTESLRCAVGTVRTEKVKLAFNEANKPVLITEVSDTEDEKDLVRCVVMPVKPA